MLGSGGEFSNGNLEMIDCLHFFKTLAAWYLALTRAAPWPVPSHNTPPFEPTRHWLHIITHCYHKNPIHANYPA